MINLTETLENGVVGFVVALLGTYLIAMRKAAEILDAEQQTRATKVETRVVELEAERQKLASMLEKPKRTLAEEHRLGVVAKVIEELGEPARIALLHLLHQETVTVTSNRNSGRDYSSSAPPGVSASAFIGILPQLVNHQIVKRIDLENSQQQTRCEFKIASGFIAAMDELLYTESKS